MTPPLQRSAGITLTDQQRLDWLRLIRSDNIGPATFIELIKRFGTAAQALDALPELAARSGNRSIKVASITSAETELDNIDRIGGQIICLGEPDYPPSLRASEAPPPVLTARGNPDCLTCNTVAIVGSRNASVSGVKLTGQLAAEIGNNNYVIVSGLARGIDSAAHRASLGSGTIAVFAGGIDHIYPDENTSLAQDIIEQGGALLTEMPLGWKPRAKDFPRRNRIVAGLSLGLLVVEASRRSGSLISARLANEMGRLVFAVPGSPLDPRSEGTNHLIKQGALLITSAADILEAIKPLADSPQQASYSLKEIHSPTMIISPDNSDRTRLLEALNQTPVAVDDIIRHTGLELGLVQMIILELDLAGLIERHAGNRISRI